MEPGQEKKATEEKEIKARPQQDNESIVRGVYEAFNRKDFETLKNLGTSSSEWLEVPFDQTLKGDTAVADAWKSWAEIFPDGMTEIRNLISSGDSVVVEGVGRGTHQGVFRSPAGDLQPSGRKVNVNFCEVYKLNNGKIIRAASYFDFYTMLRQLAPEKELRH